MFKLRLLVPYIVSVLVVGSVAIAQQPNLITPTSPPKQITPSATSEAPRRLTINVAVADVEDLKVAEGDRIAVGQLIAGRTRDSPRERLCQRNRLEAQARQLDLTLQRLEQSTITPPLPPQQSPAIATPTYLEQNAAIDRAKADVDQAEALIEAKHQELDYLAQLPNLDPL